MSKGKSITLLTIISVLMAFVIVMTFVRFPVGVKNYNSALGAIDLDYDLEGGKAYTLSISKDNDDEVKDVDEVINTISERLEILGYKTYSVKALKGTDEAVKDYDIRIELKDSVSVDQDVKTATEFGKVKFYGGDKENPSTEILSDMSIVENASYAGLGADGKSHVVAIQFTKEAHDKLFELMGDKDYYVKVTCGENAKGDETVLFNSKLPKDAFFDNVIAINNFKTEDSARRLALQIKNGGLAYKYDISEGKEITSPYGKDVALKCAVAVMTLVLVLMIIMLVLYRGLGIVASLSLLLFILGETWLMIGVPGIVLSMGGVMGIIASTALCGITTIFTMQNIKDEYANSQKTVKAAVKKGFMNSLVPVISGHVSCGAVALLLLAFVKGTVRNFAVTFGIGVGVSLIAVLLFTRMFNAVILPLPKDKEKFLRFKRNEEIVAEGTQEEAE